MEDFSDPRMFDTVDHTFVIDSGTRDMNQYPSPSAYTITFSNPFRNVVGMNLLRAHVPRTQYVIDQRNSTLTYAFETPPVPRSNLITVTLAHGDYNLPQLCDELNRCFSTVAADRSTYEITAAPLTNPAEITNKILFSCPHTFFLELDPFALGENMGFSTPVQQAHIDANLYDASSTWKAANWVDSNVFVSVKTVSTDEEAAYIGPVAAQTSKALTAATVYRQTYTALAGGPLSSLTIVATATGSPTLSANVYDADGTLVANGTATVTSNDPLTPTTIRLAALGEGILGLESVCTFTIASSAACNIFLARTNLSPDPANALELSTSGGPWVDVGAGLSLSATLAVNTTGYQVAAPGMVNLSGSRFLTIRCPEVESYLYKDRASSEVHTGIGLCTLGQYGFVAENFDYVNVKPVRLATPIGRLNKLSIRLEGEGGTLYNTQGVNHTLLVNMKCLVPRARKPQHGKTPTSILAPEYVPGSTYLSHEHW